MFNLCVTQSFIESLFTHILLGSPPPLGAILPGGGDFPRGFFSPGGHFSSEICLHGGGGGGQFSWGVNFLNTGPHIAPQLVLPWKSYFTHCSK